MTRAEQDSDELEVIVEVAGDAKVGDVSARLRAAGFFVERELPLSRVIGVRAARKRLRGLREVEGVRFVRSGGGYQLPPFDERFPQ